MLNWTLDAYRVLFGFQERVSDPAVKSSSFAARSNVSPYAPPMITMDNDDGISYTGSVT